MYHSSAPRSLATVAFPVVAALVVAGCSDSGGGPTQPDPPTQTPTVAIALSTSSLTIDQGDGGTITVTIARGGGFEGAVQLALENAPQGVTGTFSPASVPSASTSSTLRLDAAPSAAEGQHGLLVRASGQGVADGTAAVSLTVLSAEGPPPAGDWVIYNVSNSDLPQNWVSAIAIDDAGVKWVGTRNGLATIDGENWTVYTTSNSDLPGPYIFQVVPYGAGRAWVETGVSIEGACCEGNGATQFDGANWIHFTSFNSGLRGDLSHGTAIDNGGRVWRIPVGRTGLDVFADGNWTSYERPDLTVGAGMGTDDLGKVWLVGFGPGGAVIVSNDGNEWVVEEPASMGLTELITGTQITAMAVGKSGDIWLGSQKGVFHYDGSGWNEYNADNSGLPSNFVFSIAIDENGGAWIGMAGGLAHFDGDTWVAYDMQNSDLPSSFVTAVAIDGNGNKWIGTGPGLARGLAVFNENGIVW